MASKIHINEIHLTKQLKCHKSVQMWNKLQISLSKMNVNEEIYGAYRRLHQFRKTDLLLLIQLTVGIELNILILSPAPNDSIYVFTPCYITYIDVTDAEYYL